jgi:hypothetical protein
VQQGFALGCVGDDQGDACGQFDRGWESAATGSDDAQFGNAGGCHLGIVL